MHGINWACKRCVNDGPRPRPRQLTLLFTQQTLVITQRGRDVGGQVARWLQEQKDGAAIKSERINTNKWATQKGLTRRREGCSWLGQLGWLEPRQRQHSGPKDNNDRRTALNNCSYTSATHKSS